MSDFIAFVRMLFWIYTILLFARIMLSWVQIDPYHPAAQFLYNITEPFLAPIRQLLPAAGTLDFSPIVGLLLLRVIEQVIISILLTF